MAQLTQNSDGILGRVSKVFRVLGKACRPGGLGPQNRFGRASGAASLSCEMPQGKSGGRKGVAAMDAKTLPCKNGPRKIGHGCLRRFGRDGAVAHLGLCRLALQFLACAKQAGFGMPLESLACGHGFASPIIDGIVLAIGRDEGKAHNQRASGRGRY